MYNLESDSFSLETVGSNSVNMSCSITENNMDSEENMIKIFFKVWLRMLVLLLLLKLKMTNNPKS